MFFFRVMFMVEISFLKFIGFDIEYIILVFWCVVIWCFIVCLDKDIIGIGVRFWFFFMWCILCDVFNLFIVGIWMFIRIRLKLFVCYVFSVFVLFEIILMLILRFLNMIFRIFWLDGWFLVVSILIFRVEERSFEVDFEIWFVCFL